MNATNLKAAKVAAGLVLGLCLIGVLSSARAAECRNEAVRTNDAGRALFAQGCGAMRADALNDATKTD